MQINRSRYLALVVALGGVAAACSSSSSTGGGSDGGSSSSSGGSSGGSSSGGSSGSSSGGGTTLTPDTFVAQLPAAYCSVYFRCCKTTEIPNIPVLASNNLTTEAQCKASSAFTNALGFQCLPAEVNQYHAMTFDAQKAQACLSDLQNAPCTQGLVGELWGSANCKGAFVGSLPNGSTSCSIQHCGSYLASLYKPNSECASGDCNSTGVCASPHAVGGSCTSDSDCASGLYCDTGTSICQATLAAGATCLTSDQCQSPTLCYNATGSYACELVCTGQ